MKISQSNQIKIEIITNLKSHGKLKFDVTERKKVCHKDCNTIQIFTEAFPSIVGDVEAIEILSY